MDAPLVLLAGVARGEAVFCRTDLLVVTSPADSLLETEVPRNLSFPPVTAAIAVAIAAVTAAVGTFIVVIVVIVVVAGVVVIVVVAITVIVVIAVVVVVIVTVAVLGCLVVNKRLSLCTLLLALKFDILLELI